MKIKYKFVDGTVVEVEVDESIGTVITESRRLEDNLSRKERYHCCSLDAAVYEGLDFAAEETPETQMEQELNIEHISHALDRLSEVQRRRLLMLAQGLSVREIARREGKEIKTIRESIEGARKKFFKFF